VTDPPNRIKHAIFASASDAQLLSFVASGEHDALEVLYERYAKACYGLAMKVLVDPFLAEEVVQEVFLKLWAAPSSYVPERGKFSAWLLTLVYNRSIDWLRQARHRKLNSSIELDAEVIDNVTLADILPDGAITPYEEAWRQEQGRVVRGALRLLSPPERLVISLAYLGGLTQREISQRLGVPLGTIKSRTHRGLLQLRRLLEREELLGDAA
jgi:RNA polymerase sigma-70 factor (ECF subfamily)